MPNPAAGDPHTLVFDQSGDIWFTVQSGNFVGRLDVETSSVDLIPSLTSRSNPYGIVVDSNGHPWVALFGTNKLAQVDPTSLAITEITLPRTGARPRRLQVTSDDRVWYVDYREGYLGVYDPATQGIEEWQMPGGVERPSIRDGGRRIRPALVCRNGVTTQSFCGIRPGLRIVPAVVPRIPSGGGSIRHMYYHAETNEVWFGTDRNTIGRASLPQATVATESETPPEEFSVGLYPNPATDRVQIEISDLEAGLIGVTMLDVTGRAVIQQDVAPNAEKSIVDLDVSRLAAGMYFVSTTHLDRMRTSALQIIR